MTAATAVSGCSCGGGGNPNPDGGGNPTVDGGNGSDDGGGGNPGDPDGGGNPGDPDGGGGQTGEFRLEPKDPTLVVSGSTGARQAFKVYQGSQDVTTQASFTIDNTQLGNFVGANFTSKTTLGGTSTVRARIGNSFATTGITVKLNQKVPDTTPGAPPPPTNPDTRFDGPAETSYKPQIVYPNSGVLVPPNLGQLEIHFVPNNASTNLFELAFTNSIIDVRVYLRCYLPTGFPALPAGVSRGCVYTPQANVWKYLSESNRGKDPVRLVVRATSDAAGSKVATSDPISIQFAQTEIKGALYYWTTSGGTGVMRYDFAGSEAPSAALRANNINASNVTCVGCHALSRNGKKLVAEVQGQHDGRISLIDLASFKPTDKAPVTPNYQSTFESWNPDGTKFVGVYGDRNVSKYGLLIFKDNNNTPVFESEIPGTGTAGFAASHPDWSPDGKTIAYTSMGGGTATSQTNQRNFKGAIRMVTEKTGGGWNAPVEVVPSQGGVHRYYPAIAPDNSFLVYNESTCPTPTSVTNMNCNGDTDPSAKLWAAKLEANAQRVELARANAGGPLDKAADGTPVTNLTNSYPKWSPFVTRGSSSVANSRLMWVTFSSSRNYGLRTMPDSGSSENPKTTLLWMAAVDPDKVKNGVDPSYPAFALPFQDITTSNHIAQWAQYLVSDGCRTEGEAGCGYGGATCCNGLQCIQTSYDPPIPCSANPNACVCTGIQQCVSSFEKCSPTTPCCDGQGLSCLDESTGGECKGNNCSCRPVCSNPNETCDALTPCCDGLSCISGKCKIRIGVSPE